MLGTTHMRQPQPPMVQNGFYLRVEQDQRLRELSEKTGASVSELVRRAIDVLLGIPPRDATERALNDIDPDRFEETEARARAQVNQAIALLRSLPDHVNIYRFERDQLYEAIRLIRDLRFLRVPKRAIAAASQKNQLARRRAAAASKAKATATAEKGDVDTAA